MSRASEIAYQEIRKKVLSGELRRDQKLTERELAELCGVSRTPVRDALRRLEAEMLVQRTDTQRWFIREWNVDQIEEIFTLRCLLESHAAMRAASRMTDAEFAQLEQLNGTIFDIIRDESQVDVANFLAANNEFHQLILEAARSERLTAMRRVLFEPSSSNLTSRTYNRSQIRRSHADHEELIFAFRRRDPHWARLIMNNHIHHALMMSLHQDDAAQSDPL